MTTPTVTQDDRTTASRSTAVPTGFALLLVLAAMNLRPAITGLSPLLPEIEAAYGLTPPSAVLLVAVPVLVLGLGAPLAPWLARRVGQTRAVLVGLVVLSVGLLVRSLWGPALFPATVLAAVGITVVAVALPAVVKSYDPARQGHWTAVYGFAMAVGAGVAPAVTAFLERAGVPVRASVGAWALLAAVGVVAWLLPRWTREHEAGAVDAAPSGSGGFGALRTTAGRSLALYFGLQAFLFFVVVTYLPQFARDSGTATELAALLLTFFSLLAAVGSWVAPRLVASLPDPRPMMLGLSLASLVGMGMLALGGPVVVAVTLIGIGQGSIFPTALALFVVRAADPATAASLSMTSQSLGFVGAAVAIVVLAQVHHAVASWPVLWLVALGTVVVQGLVGRWAGEPRTVSVVR